MDIPRLTVEGNTARLAPAEVSYSWHLVAPMIDAALERGHGEFDLEHLRTFVLQGNMQLWVGYEESKIFAVCLTECATYPNYKVLRVVVLAGRDMKEWTHLEPLLEGYARATDCAFIEGWTRPGMAKVVEPLGYKPHYTIIRKPVTQGLH